MKRCYEPTQGKRKCCLDKIKDILSVKVSSVTEFSIIEIIFGEIFGVRITYLLFFFQSTVKSEMIPNNKNINVE